MFCKASSCLAEHAKRMRLIDKQPNGIRMHAPDGVHLNELGQLAMGFAMIRGLGGPKEVSLAHVDAAARSEDQHGTGVAARAHAAQHRKAVIVGQT